MTMGGRPFKVSIDKIIARVYNSNYSDDGRAQYSEEPNHIFTEVKRVFIGESPRNKMTKFSGGYGPRFDGNSILLDIGNREYVFIGHRIFRFEAKFEITSYVSPVSNNDVCSQKMTLKLYNI